MIHVRIQGWLQPDPRRGPRALTRQAGEWMRALQLTGRLGATVDQAEQEGLVFAFRARSFAVAAMTLWLLESTAWPRNAYYLSLAVTLFLFGLAPFLLRRHRHAVPIKLAFVVLDVVLVTAAVLTPPPAGLAVDWPVQTRTRGPEFLFLLMLLGEAALTYSPLRVLWTGVSIAVVWSAGIAAVYLLPSTTSLTDLLGSRHASDLEALHAFLTPTVVSLTGAATQVIAALILTVLLALAVLRSRRHLLAQVRAEALKSDLARYVSPDVADALTARVAQGFGDPVEREVAVLFADIVGFTGVTESLPPSRTFALLRSFQERSSATVVAHRGTIDKYLGDGLMATFGALQDEDDAPARAIACAGELLDAIERWNAKRGLRDAAPIRVAVGVHCGTVTVGNLGSTQRLEFTVVGDVVNVASRLEKAARELDCTLVVSDACLRAAGAAVVPARIERSFDLRIRGRDAPLLVHLGGCRFETVDAWVDPAL